MRLRAYGCPACGEWHRRVRGAFALGVGLQVKCPACHNVETITAPVPTPEEVLARA